MSLGTWTCPAQGLNLNVYDCVRGKLSHRLRPECAGPRHGNSRIKQDRHKHLDSDHMGGCCGATRRLRYRRLHAGLLEHALLGDAG